MPVNLSHKNNFHTVVEHHTKHTNHNRERYKDSNGNIITELKE